MFGFGRSAGVLDGVLAALGIQSIKVLPQRWKKATGLTGRDKDASRTLALALYPEMAKQLRRKKDSGRADALLIASWGQGELVDRLRKAGL